MKSQSQVPTRRSKGRASFAIEGCGCSAPSAATIAWRGSDRFEFVVEELADNSGAFVIAAVPVAINENPSTP